MSSLEELAVKTWHRQMKAGAAVIEEELAGESGMKQTKKKEEGSINRLNSQRHLREECLERKKNLLCF